MADARSAPDTDDLCAPTVDANIDSSFTVSSWPDGHRAGSAAALIGRFSSNLASHSRQRNS